MEQPARQLALFDFDDTLFHLATDWATLRRELRARAAERGLDANGAGVYELAFRLRDDALAQRLIAEAELAGLEAGFDLVRGQELYREEAARGSTIAVVTHNGRAVVEAFFRRSGLRAPDAIFGRTELGGWKADSDALVRYAGDRAGVVVGDSDHDRRLAERLGVQFVDVEDPLRSYYDAKAAQVDELAATYESELPYKRFFYGVRFSAVLEALDARPGDAVLELGCGSGYYTRALVELGARVTATDLAPAYVEQARSLAPGARFRVEDAQRLSFSDASFDRVLATEVIEHVPDPEAVVREARRVLRRGGVLALSTPARRSPLNLAYALKRRIRRYEFNEHLHELTPRELRRLLEPHFELEQFERVNAVLPYPLDELYIRLGSPALGALGWLERALRPLGWTIVVRARAR